MVVHDHTEARERMGTGAEALAGDAGIEIEPVAG